MNSATDKPKIIRAATISGSLDSFCKGLLRKLSDEYEVVAVASDDASGQLQSMAEREGVEVRDIPMKRHISPFSDLKSLWRLYRAFRKEKPLMVHSMTPKAGLLCMMAAKMARVPVRVHTFTGLVFPTATGLKKKILMFTDRLTCSSATHIIPEGQGVLNDLRDNKITRKPMKVLGHGNVRGIDLSHFDPERVQPCSPDDRFTFVFVGRLVGDKGINELVEAFIRLNKEIPATRLLLVGDAEDDLDPLKEETKKQIDKCDSIYAVGEQRDVRVWFASADCAVLPSYREGFPNVVIEAGAMGLPQIVTDINGSREIIKEDINGTIIPSHDSDALYKAMHRMVTDSSWRNSMALNAREMIASRYEQGYVHQCLINYYHEILQ